MSDIIAKAQESSKITQPYSPTPWQMIGPAFKALSGLTLSDLNSQAKAEVEALMLAVNQILSVYPIKEEADYEKMSDSDVRAILCYISEINQLCIEAEAERVMHELETADQELPVAAIQEVRQHPDVFVPLLIRTLEQAVLSVRNGDEPDDGTSFFAVFLLMELEVDEAFPVLLDLLRLPEEGIFGVLGDGVHEIVAPMLALFSRGDTKVLSDLVQDLDIHLYVRWNAAEAYKYLVRDALISRERAIEALQEDFNGCVEREDIEILAPIAIELGNLAAASALESIRAAYQRDLVDESVVDLEFIESQIAGGEETVHQEIGDCKPTGMPDTIAELSRWHSFCDEPSRPAEPKPAPTSISRPHFSEGIGTMPAQAATIRRGGKVGRNDPCPCGSGKKFKKCCR